VDELIVLRSSTRRLAKLIQSTPEGLQVQGYDEAATFAWEALPVDGIEALAMELEQLAKDPHACVIRGGIKEASWAKRLVNRRQHVNRDGAEGDWENHKPGRRWVAFDIDKLAVPEGIRPDGRLTKGDAAAIAGYAKRTLPAEFHGAACVYHLSSSAGLHGWDKVSLHLWFWMDRPVYDLSWRTWCDGKGVDASLFKSVQAHYTADPVFADMADPLAGVRFGFLDGAAEVVADASLQDFDAWQRAEGQRVAEKRAEIEARRAAIVPGAEQSADAVRKYALKALAGAIDDILSAPVGGRHDMLCRKAMHIGGHVQPGCLDEAEAWAAIDDAIVAVYEASRHAGARKAAREFLEKGMERPYPTEERGRKAAAKKKPDLRVVPPLDDDVPMPEPGSSAAKKAKPAKKKSAGPEWVDLGQKGKILSTSHNMAVLLDWLGYQPRRNLMSHQTDWEGAPSDIAMECRQAAMGGVIMDAAIQNEWRLPATDCWRHLGVIEARRAFHPVTDWARSKPWDGVSRFGQLFDTLAIQDDFEEYRELLRVQLDKWLLAGGKCLSLDALSGDGVAAQGVLVLQGKQDMGKTRWFKALVPDSAWFSEGLTMDPSNTDHVIQGTSTFICELGELDATTRKSDVAQLKAFLTRSKDVYRSPYGREREVYARRTIFGATVNPETFLVDDTGNRRFWVMPVKAVNADHGIDLQQLWAEAMARAEAGETCWMPNEHKADQLALAAKFENRSEWADDFFKVFRLPLPSETGQAVRVSDIRKTILPDRNWSSADMKSFTQFLKRIKVHVSQRQGAAHATVVRW
jgi:hypothetical protein